MKEGAKQIFLLLMSNCVGECKNPAYDKDAAALKMSKSRVKFCYRKAWGKFSTTRETRHGIETTLAQLCGSFGKKEGKEKNVFGILLIFSFPADFYINKTGFSLTAALIAQLQNIDKITLKPKWTSVAD